MPTATRSTKLACRPKSRAKTKSIAAPASARSRPWKLRRAGSLTVLESPLLSAQGWLVHGFSTRPGGSSLLARPHGAGGPPEKILNLGFCDWDKRERVDKNRLRFSKAMGAAKMRLIPLRQFHSDLIHAVDGPPDQPLRGDALITRTPGLLLAVQTADCIPILLADPEHRVVAAIHAGWRGTLKRIAEKTLGRMRMLYGTRPEDVVAALGAGIGRCCYEVGPEVVKEFGSQFPAASDWFEGPFEVLVSGEDPNPLPWLNMRPPGHQPPPPTAQLDLHAANRSILENAGVRPGRIDAAEFCTACRNDLFFSYRREKETGRLMAAIGIR